MGVEQFPPQKWTSSPVLCAPDAGAAVASFTTGNGVYGAWSQILASIGASDAILVGFTIIFPSASRTAFFARIGIGAAGSETAIASINLGGYAVSTGMYFPLSVPVLIPAGSRVSVSGAASAATGSYGAAIHYIVLPL